MLRWRWWLRARVGVVLLFALYLMMSAGFAGGVTRADDDDNDDDGVPIVITDDDDDGGAERNLVQVINRRDDRLRVRGRIDMNAIPGDEVRPENGALAYSSCVGCETFAVAMQLNFVRRGAPVVAPVNEAVALNVECSRCYTVARAIQYTLPVDDPRRVPEEAQQLRRELERELRDIARDRGQTAASAEGRINAVIGRFTTFAEALQSDRRAETTEPTSPGATLPASTPPRRAPPQWAPPHPPPVPPQSAPPRPPPVPPRPHPRRRRA